MDLLRSNDSNARFLAYVDGLTSIIGHADRAKPLRDYCLGHQHGDRARELPAPAEPARSCLAACPFARPPATPARQTGPESSALQSFDKLGQHRDVDTSIDDHAPPVRQHDLNAPGPCRHRRPNVGHHNRRHKAGPVRRALATGTTPSKQQRRRNAVTASSRRHQPRTT